MKNDKRTNSDLQTLHGKLMSNQYEPHLKIGGGIMYSGSINSSCSNNDSRRVTANRKEQNLV